MPLTQAAGDRRSLSRWKLPVAETSNGKVRGFCREHVSVFRGIRYAASTAGANRFLPPQPCEKWAGIRDAFNWGASAPQNPVEQSTVPFYAWYSAIQPISEDCLFLNVFTPGLDGSKRPVMFWVHGGGWREFSGTAPGFDGTNLARAQDVVVITVNHRLGAFGFLLIDEPDDRFADPANCGLLDLVMALKWVRANAAAIGGDPDNVTIFGESGGASKITALLTMPAAKGLFHKAIIQSSAGGLHFATREEAAGHAAGLAKALGWSKLDGHALQKLPIDDLLSALRIFAGPFRATLDGHTFESVPFRTPGPAVSAHVPLLAGCTNMEATYYLRSEPRNFDLNYPDVTERLMRFMNIEGIRANAIVGDYRAAYPGFGPFEILAMVASDYMFKRNTARIASLHAASGAAVYCYRFDRETPVEGGRLHSPHTSEVPFIFGTTEQAAACVGGGPDIEPMTEIMMATWGAFARTGTPDNPHLPAWPFLGARDHPTMVLNTECELRFDPGGRVQASLEGLPFFGYGHSIRAIVCD